MQPINTAYLWLPLAVITLHMIEEFVWPGGFVEWYRHYPPGEVVTVTTRLIIIVNVVFVALALTIPLLGPSPRGWALWLVVAAVAGINGIFHLIATLRARAYSPGVVTGVLLYIPLAVVGAILLLKHGLVSVGTAGQALFVAAAYQLWSNWKHRRASHHSGEAR